MRTKLHYYIFAGIALGAIVGYALWSYDDGARTAHAAAVAAGEAAGAYEPPSAYAHTMWILNLIGPTIFMAALKMIIAPLVFASIVAGVTSLPNLRELGAVGWKTLAYYAITTALSVSIGLAFVLTIQPGKKASAQGIRAERVEQLADREAEYERSEGAPAVNAGGKYADAYLRWLYVVESERHSHDQEAGRYAKVAAARDRTPGDIFIQDIVQPLLSNPFASLTEANALGMIFFALLLGVACAVVGGPARPVVEFFHGLNEVILRITHWLMSVSPVAIGAIVAYLVATKGPTVFHTLGWYVGTVISAIAVHVVFLLTIGWVVGGRSPWEIWKGIREAWMIAFSTRSSAATLPVTIACTTEKLKVSPKVARFALPLGATMNMDGTALYEGVAVIFLIQIFGGLPDVPIAEMTPMTTFLIFVTAVLAAVGAAAVPDAGLVTMVLVANAVGLPVYYLPLIFAVDAFLDMFRTSTNVLGDVVGTVVVSRLERARLGD